VLTLPPTVRVFVAVEPIDMLGSFDALDVTAWSTAALARALGGLRGDHFGDLMARQGAYRCVLLVFHERAPFAQLTHVATRYCSISVRVRRMSLFDSHRAHHVKTLASREFLRALWCIALIPFAL
jgi:hypothetical protein